MMLSSWCWRVAAVLVWVAAVAAMWDTSKHSTNSGDNSVVQKLESSLLASFGLKRRPSAKMDVVVPPYMLELFRRQQEGQIEAEMAPTTEALSSTLTSEAYNTARSFTHEESEADGQYPTHKMRLRFNLSKLPKEEILQSAELRLSYVRHPSAPDHGPEDKDLNTKLRGREQRRWTSGAAPYLKRVKVYDVLRRATRNSEPALRMLDTEIIDARRSGVRSLDVSDAVRRWIALPNRNYGLLVEVVPFNKTTSLDASHVRLRRFAEEERWSEQQPLLVVYASDGKAKLRTKRAAGNKHKKIRETCRRHRLHVDFRQVGWDDWIVARYSNRDVKPTPKIYISNLNMDTTEDDLRKAFKEFATIVDITLKHKDTGIVFAFIEFDTTEGAEEAVKAMNQKEFMNKELKVEFARGGGRDRGDRGDRGGYRGRGDGDRRPRDYSDRPRGCFNCQE